LLRPQISTHRQAAGFFKSTSVRSFTNGPTLVRDRRIATKRRELIIPCINNFEKVDAFCAGIFAEGIVVEFETPSSAEIWREYGFKSRTVSQKTGVHLNAEFRA